MTNNETLNVKAGLDGLTEIETKLSSYNSTPFTKICLGMKVDDVTNWIMLNYTARSLYSVIADEVYHPTNLGRSRWMSLIVNSRLQDNCNTEGFNAQLKMNTNVRIGYVANNEKNCRSPDSLIGFGIHIDNNLNQLSWSSGNIYFRNPHLPAFGYIFVQ